MSGEKLDVVRRVYEAVLRNDSEAVLALYDVEVEWDFTDSPFRDFLPRRVYRGHQGIRDFIRERYEAWQSIDDDLEELIASGDRIVTVVKTHGVGRTSGVEVERIHAGLWTFRNGLITRVEWVESRDAALALAAGTRG